MRNRSKRSICVVLVILLKGFTKRTCDDFDEIRRSKGGHRNHRCLYKEFLLLMLIPFSTHVDMSLTPKLIVEKPSDELSPKIFLLLPVATFYGQNMHCQCPFNCSTFNRYLLVCSYRNFSVD